MWCVCVCTSLKFIPSTPPSLSQEIILCFCQTVEKIDTNPLHLWKERNATSCFALKKERELHFCYYLFTRFWCKHLNVNKTLQSLNLTLVSFWFSFGILRSVNLTFQWKQIANCWINCKDSFIEIEACKLQIENVASIIMHTVKCVSLLLLLLVTCSHFWAAPWLRLEMYCAHYSGS